eukprot:Gregarina_sp_Poly_1__8246@NODE_4801_length_488_cov_200_002375_g3301_i0_p1_GENE_NODE_4801_length_488_cov_200_002375_g3301_i0NODE_4801_length_488_cov_200_002375_g3301_i0_p1_ORF_typecomplete_len105_score15_75_NODE_4801_length_488_cov_200_002375_g3301_i082396
MSHFSLALSFTFNKFKEEFFGAIFYIPHSENRSPFLLDQRAQKVPKKNWSQLLAVLIPSASILFCSSSLVNSRNGVSLPTTETCTFSPTSSVSVDIEAAIAFKA